MENKHDISKFGFQPLLKSKYLVILMHLAILAIMASAFLPAEALTSTYVFLGVIGLIILGLHQNVRYQRLNRRLRPFIVMRILQCIVTIALLLMLYLTISLIDGNLVPYLVYYLIALSAVLQFYNVFRLASRAKKDFPDRCEFC